ncbi:AfsR/SARP family transcriptional regulator [Streptomyces sp. NPDC005805]|uniref:AfsR/SARP family transcriptional regulator n=1 Tax=Streptomyces sp. NPDC005805 TaxID=3157068 RepID=UPI0033E52044
MLVHILGPLRAEVDGVPVPLGGRRTQTILALLALEENRVVPTDRLVDAVWGAAPPASARTQIRICVSAIRRAVAEAATTGPGGAGAPGPGGAGAPAEDPIETHTLGYRLRLPPGGLDSALFDARVGRARRLAREGRRAEAVLELRGALALWNGPALAGLTSPALEPAVRRLEEERVRATEERLRLELELGRHEDVIGELIALTAEHPFRERLHGQLMLALQRSCRTAEALAAYRRIRLTLVEELGIEPGPELSGLEQAILTGERLSA